MEAQLQTYLQEKGVEDLLKDIVVELCKETPDDVLRFIKKYITKRMVMMAPTRTRTRTRCVQAQHSGHSVAKMAHGVCVCMCSRGGQWNVCAHAP